jgi:hypothetical protein
MRKFVIAITAAALLTAGSLSSAGKATAAPSGGMTASEVINQLQAAGNNVVVNKIGSGSPSKCEVISVRPVTQTPLRPNHLVLGAATLMPRTTVHVSIVC